MDGKQDQLVYAAFDAYFRGKDAGLSGCPKKDNPHAPYTVTRPSWRRGWEQGRMKKNRVRAV
jgi:ribosome modulation factor